ncbi:hypothetical protein CYMTET_3210 [Cymbomonas tetramitiformis]|uniref:Chromo domain-containing protein n=1 Tax=Cymbomonas tetramitiformis TaxID=36881 RepID=A0AAE0H3L1_9CHLO|nr:hypothetical protein CYMTET_3210 [Cymbomonas tetramitiformis]|eukprot:gene924-1439_t
MGRSKGAKRRKCISSEFIRVAQSNGPIKRTQKNPYDIVGSDAITFTVNAAKAERLTYGTSQFLVIWQADGKPLGSDHDTWEPEQNIPGLETEILAFRAGLAVNSE